MNNLETIVNQIYTKRGTDFENYITDLESQDLKDKLSEIGANKNDFLDIINRHKKKERHVALIYSLILLKVFPDELQIKLICSTLALNVNYSSFVISILSDLEIQGNEDKAVVMSLLAKAYRNQFNFAKALKHYESALLLYTQNNDDINQSWMIYAIGKMYLNYLQQPSRSLEYFLGAKGQFEKSQSSKSERGISACLDEIGDVHRQAYKDYDLALSYYVDAVSHNEKSNYRLGLSRNYAHMAMCHEGIGNLKEAERFMRNSIMELKNNPGQEKGLGIRLTQLGKILLRFKNHEEGYKALHEGQKYNLDYKNSEYIILNNIYQGDYYGARGDKDKALDKFKNAVEISRKTRFFNLASIAFRKISSIYFNMNLYNESKFSLIDSIKSNINHWKNIKEGSPMISEVSKKYELGSMYQSLFYKINDDYELNFQNAISSLDNVYQKLVDENNKQVQNARKIIMLGNSMAGINHKIRKLFTNVLSIFDVIILEKNINEENLKNIRNLKKEILDNSDIMSSANFKEITSNFEETSYKSNFIEKNIIKQFKKDYSFKDIKIMYKPATDICRLYIDESSLKTILYNLLLNSAEAFTRRKGSDIEKTIYIVTKCIPNSFIIELTDNAGGIQENDYPNIFNFGYTSKIGGTGWGLPTVKSILDMYQASIVVKNTEDGVVISLNFKVI